MRKTVYIITSEFPQFYETFITQEIDFLKRQGWEIRIISLKKPQRPLCHRENEGLIANTLYLPSGFGWRSLGSFLYFLFFHPFRCCRAIGALRFFFSDGLSIFGKTLYVFFQSFFLAGMIFPNYRTVFLYCHWFTYPASIGFFLSRLLPVHYAVSAHAHDVFCSWSSHKAKGESADFILTCSKFARDFLLKTYEFCPEKVILQYHGVYIFPAPDAAQKEKIIVSAGRLVPTKGFEILLLSLTQNRNLLKEWKVLIFGEGPLRAQLEQMIAEHGLQNVFLQGEISHDALRAVLGNASIFVLPCYQKEGTGDGLPNVILEAMERQCLALSTSVSAIPEVIVDGVTGVLVPPYSPDRLAEQMRVMTEKDTLRQELSQRGRAFVTQYFNREILLYSLCDIFQKRAARKINLLYVVYSFESGGAQKIIYELIRGHSKDDFAISVCCLTGKGFYSALFEELVGRENVFHFEKRSGCDCSVFRSLRDLVRKKHIDIVSSHLWSASLWTRLSLLGFPSAKVIIFEHSFDSWRKKYQIFANRILSVVTEKIIAVSNLVGDFYRKAGIPQEKIVVCQTGVDLQYFEYIRERNLNRISDACSFKVISVGRLVPEKGFHVFIDAVASLVSRGFPIQGMIVGEGPEQLRLETLVQQKGIHEHISFLPPRQDIRAILEGADVLVLASLYEGRPLVILEAQASGVPVVASETRGAESVIQDGIDGLLFPVGNSLKLAEHLALLLQDKKLRRKITRAAYERVSGYSAFEFIQSVEDVYKKTSG